MDVNTIANIIAFYCIIVCYSCQSSIIAAIQNKLFDFDLKLECIFRQSADTYFL